MFWVFKSFCRNPVLSWAIRYSVFQPIKFVSSFKSVCDNPFSIFWHLMVKFGYNKDFKAISRMAFFRFGEKIIILSFFKNLFFIYSFFFYIFKNVITNQNILKKKNLKKIKIMICLFHWNGKTPFWKWP